MIPWTCVTRSSAIWQRYSILVVKQLSSKSFPQTSESCNDNPDIKSEIEEAQGIKQLLRSRVSKSREGSSRPLSKEHTEQFLQDSELSEENNVTTYTIEQHRHKNEKVLRQKHFESERSQSLLDLAGYNDTDSKSFVFKNEQDFDSYVQKEEMAKAKRDKSYGTEFKKNTFQFNPKQQSPPWKKWNSDSEETHGNKEEFVPLHIRESFYRKTSRRFKEDDYNYGLPGLGKKPKPQRARSNIPPIHGEVLFGLFPCLMALQESRRRAYQVFVKKQHVEKPRPEAAELLRLAEEQGAEIVPCRTELLDTLSHDRPHQGFCLDASKLKPIMVDDAEESSDLLETGKHKLILVMDGIQDPMNFGAVLRSSYYLGVDRVITVKDNSCALSPVVSKASAGVLEIMPVYAVKYLSPFLQAWQKKGWHIVGTTVDKDDGESSRSEVTPLNEVKVNQDTILVIGNEGQGIEKPIESLCDQLVSIKPGRQISPLMDSLNVSVATGIILHHLLHTR